LYLSYIQKYQVLKINIYYQTLEFQEVAVIPKVNANKEIIRLTGKHY